MLLDQDQMSAIVIAVIVFTCGCGCWIRHIREQSRRAGLYDLQDGNIV